jgi:hypothetical protein
MARPRVVNKPVIKKEIELNEEEPIKIEQVYKGFVIHVERTEEEARIVISKDGLYCNEFKAYNNADDIELEINRAKRCIDDGAIN